MLGTRSGMPWLASPGSSAGVDPYRSGSSGH
jgi:hypothetical protein